MPLDSYPFSKRYGWCNDRFGLSWQIMHSERAVTQKIVPSFLFVREVCGKAEEAVRLYTSIFDNSEVGEFMRYGPGAEPEDPNHVQHVEFTVEGYRFAAMDSGLDHRFGFNEAVSIIVNCDTQEEIDDLWSKLSAVPESEQCGWLKDRFGVSWQIVPRELDEMMQAADEETLARVVQSFLPMKKLDLAALRDAHSGASR
jgi:predicted 3-demethylubiquinone-9 3-methyltransferase (glyoxalase superfamily)